MSGSSALIVTYVWPPTGGVGANACLKLAKYLPQHGVHASVLTVANPSVPLVDESLMRQIPEGLEVLRAPHARAGLPHQTGVLAARQDRSRFTGGAPSLKRRAAAAARQFLIPDPQVLWQPHAQRSCFAGCGPGATMWCSSAHRRSRRSSRGRSCVRSERQARARLPGRVAHAADAVRDALALGGGDRRRAGAGDASLRACGHRDQRSVSRAVAASGFRFSIRRES